ncbi:hypothetical protein AB4144_05610, partial [Rhizobiaceae sp. 2RAB30]
MNALTTGNKTGAKHANGVASAFTAGLSPLLHDCQRIPLRQNVVSEKAENGPKVPAAGKSSQRSGAWNCLSENETE